MVASHSTMFDILVKVGLGEHYGVFLEQKITPDIVCCLAAIEMQQLGISTKKGHGKTTQRMCKLWNKKTTNESK